MRFRFRVQHNLTSQYVSFVERLETGQLVALLVRRIFLVERS